VWSCGVIVARKMKAGYRMLMGVAIQNIAAGLASVAAGLVLHGTQFGYFTLDSVTGILYLAVAGTIIAVPCYYFVLQTMPIHITSTVTFVAPLITLLVGIVYLGERFTQDTVLAIAFILTGVIIVQLAKMPPKAKQPPLSKRLPTGP